MLQNVAKYFSLYPNGAGYKSGQKGEVNTYQKLGA